MNERSCREKTGQWWDNNDNRDIGVAAGQMGSALDYVPGTCASTGGMSVGFEHACMWASQSIAGMPEILPGSKLYCWGKYTHATGSYTDHGRTGWCRTRAHKKVTSISMSGQGWRRDDDNNWVWALHVRKVSSRSNGNSGGATCSWLSGTTSDPDENHKVVW